MNLSMSVISEGIFFTDLCFLLSCSRSYLFWIFRVLSTRISSGKWRPMSIDKARYAAISINKPQP
jgi:hypothetical protein